LNSNLSSDLWYISRVQKLNEPVAPVTPPVTPEPNEHTEQLAIKHDSNILTPVVQEEPLPEPKRSLFSILRSYLPF
jgi:hypothetical protein